MEMAIGTFEYYLIAINILGFISIRYNKLRKKG